MGGPFPPDSSPSRVGFGADLASAARALISQPSVPLVSVAATLLLQALPNDRTGVARFVFASANFVLDLFLLGWCGAQRVFFQRHFQSTPVSIRHLLRLVAPFVGRFFVLEFLAVITLMALFSPLAHVLSIEVPDHPTWSNISVSLKLLMILFISAIIGGDFALTFVTPALAYTTRSAWYAIRIGLAMIRQTWPRSALYVLCPPLALTLLNYVFPVGGLVVQLTTTTVVTLVGLLAKGAIAAFYLRERGSHSEDGAAYIIAQDEPP